MAAEWNKKTDPARIGVRERMVSIWAASKNKDISTTCNLLIWLVEVRGLEPLTSWVRSTRSPRLSYTPTLEPEIRPTPCRCQALAMGVIGRKK